MNMIREDDDYISAIIGCYDSCVGGGKDSAVDVLMWRMD